MLMAKVEFSYTTRGAMASRKFIGNFVAIDAIHQDRVRKELLAQKNWEKNHGYMIEEIKKVQFDQIQSLNFI